SNADKVNKESATQGNPKVDLDQPSSSHPSTYAKVANLDREKAKVNFWSLEYEVGTVEADLFIPMASVQEVSDRFTNSLYGYFIGNHIEYPLVKQYAWNKWSKHGLQKVMMNNGLFYFNFVSKHGLENLLKNGPYMIQNVPII
ncbi:zinc knuckle CX2CX4HX4C containing protein, partial [Tanacetum coccineum]